MFVFLHISSHLPSSQNVSFKTLKKRSRTRRRKRRRKRRQASRAVGVNSSYVQFNLRWVFNVKRENGVKSRYNEMKRDAILHRRLHPRRTYVSRCACTPDKFLYVRLLVAFRCHFRSTTTTFDARYARSPFCISRPRRAYLLRLSRAFVNYAPSVARYCQREPRVAVARFSKTKSMSDSSAKSITRQTHDRILHGNYLTSCHKQQPLPWNIHAQFIFVEKH